MLNSLLFAPAARNSGVGTETGLKGASAVIEKDYTVKARRYD